MKTILLLLAVVTMIATGCQSTGQTTTDNTNQTPSASPAPGGGTKSMQ